MKSCVITGGVGCGKSIFCASLRVHLGMKVTYFSADECAKTASESPVIFEELVNLFGEVCCEMIEGRLRINKSYVRKIIFRDAEMRKKLESVLHPVVLDCLQDQQILAREAECELFLAEVPLHYEVNSTVEADLIIVVASSRTMQIRRLMEHRGLDNATIENILKSQWPIEAKVEKSDVVIWNDGDLSALEAQMLTLARQFSLA
jgi:dephospho-CoA kinase